MIWFELQFVELWVTGQYRSLRISGGSQTKRKCGQWHCEFVNVYNTHTADDWNDATNWYDSGEYITAMLGLYDKRYSYHILHTRRSHKTLRTQDTSALCLGSEVSWHLWINKCSVMVFFSLCSQCKQNTQIFMYGIIIDLELIRDKRFEKHLPVY